MTSLIRRSLSALILLLASMPALAQLIAVPPRIRVAAAEQPVAIVALDTHVVIHGVHAQTTQTVTFRNPNPRVLEGELEFPLPDGATVSGFALDVGGEMVEGAVLPRDRARIVLEAEIRKGVDPGLVEQVRGNLYRARVYPLPAQGTRSVRLRWVSSLVTQGDDAAYHLPLPYTGAVGTVKLRLEVVRPERPEISGGFGNVALEHWEDRWVATALWHDAVPQRDLLVKLPRVPDPAIAVEATDREAWFSIAAKIPAGAAGEGVEPRRIGLAWDASGSRDAEAVQRELAFIERLLQAWPRTSVDLVVLRDRAEPMQSFGPGDGRRLLAALREAPRDGATALSALDLAGTRQDLWLVASDGLATLGEALPAHGGVPVWPLTGATVADRSLLRHLAARTGGELLDLVTLDRAAALAAITQPRVRYLRTEGTSIADLHVLPSADRSRVLLAGRLAGRGARLTLVFGSGRSEPERVVLNLSRVAAPPGGRGPVAIAWAQAHAEALALFPGKNAEALLTLGRQFGLVTPGTSLLVLETLEQHLLHEVEPAASRGAMYAQYVARTGELRALDQRARDEHLGRVVQLWQERVKWWETEFRYQVQALQAPKMARDQARREAAGASTEMAERTMAGAASSAAPAMMAPPPAPEPKDAKVADRSASAAIAIEAWDPQTPYLARLRTAGRGKAYAAYLEERSSSASPAFFLDCAEFFLRTGDRAIGLRVLSNLAELKLDDPALLRVLAWRLSQAGELDAAADVLEKVLRLRPEEPQSRRDLALVLGDRAERRRSVADAQRALDLLYEVVTREWDRFPEIELIALMELNRLIARAGRQDWGRSLDAGAVDARLRKLLTVDLRVSLAWDADLTDVDLHVFESTGEHAYYGANRTSQGGLVSRDFTRGYGPEEYIVRKAAPGQYAIKVHYYGSSQQTLIGPATLIATVFTNYGRPDEKKEILTLRLADPRDMEEVGVVTIGGR